jgi:hypothetical protein
MPPKKKTHHHPGNANVVMRQGQAYDKDLTLFVEDLHEKHPVFDMEHAKALWENALDGHKLTVRGGRMNTVSVGCWAQAWGDVVMPAR